MKLKPDIFYIIYVTAYGIFLAAVILYFIFK